MRGGSYTQIRKNQIRRCDKCGQEICFAQNRNGKWFPVDVVYHPGLSGPAYKHSAGAYKNMIPWHVCVPQRDFSGERLVGQAQRCSMRLAQAALALYRQNPDADLSRLTAVLERMSARIQRRTEALPEASRAYIRF